VVASNFVRYILKQSAITLNILMSDEFVDELMGQLGTFISARHLPVVSVAKRGGIMSERVQIGSKARALARSESLKTMPN
jgi:hypothetical protein